jgi:hemolysin III
MSSAVPTAPLAAPYSKLEEWLNSLSHGVAALLSLAGMIVLIVDASLLGDPWKIVSVSIYGSSLLLLFLASTLYHAVSNPQLKWRLKTFDHCAIFLLIAGTYTPFLLVNLRAGAGWWLFGIIWGLAAFGIAMKLTFGHRFKPLQVTTYLLMGWLVLVASSSLGSSVNSLALWLLVTGGVVYTMGVVFYLVKRIPFNHAIWHLFVLGGSGCHFFAVYYGTLSFGVRGF